MENSSKTVCDGSVVTWLPQWEDDFCDECGHVTGQTDRAEPKFHGKTVRYGDGWFCSRCGEEFIGYAMVSAMLMDKLPAMIEAQMNRVSPLYRYLDKK